MLPCGTFRLGSGAPDKRELLCHLSSSCRVMGHYWRRFLAARKQNVGRQWLQRWGCTHFLPPLSFLKPYYLSWKLSPRTALPWSGKKLIELIWHYGVLVQVVPMSCGTWGIHPKGLALCGLSGRADSSPSIKWFPGELVETTCWIFLPLNYLQIKKVTIP